MSTDALEFRQFSVDSAEYRQALALREQVLRKPLGKTLTAEDTDGEQQQLHFGLFEQGHLLAGLIIKPLSAEKVILRQMAVQTGRQNSGAGRQLIERTERELQCRGVGLIELSARETAQGFYARLGFKSHGKIFIILNIPHLKMSKILANKKK